MSTTTLPIKETPQQELMRLRAENQALKEGADRALGCKISDKTGAIVVYGLGARPVTLYYNQWKRLIKFIPALDAFLDKHKAQCNTDKNVPWIPKQA